MSTPSRAAPTVAEVHRAIFEDMPASSEVFVAGLAEEATVALIDVLAELDEPPTVRLLARESVLKWLRRDFHPASTAADLAAERRLSLRATEEEFANGLVVGEESVVSVVTANERVTGLGTDDAEFVQAMRERCAEAWEAADSFDLRTPARSQVYETLADEISPEGDLRNVWMGEEYGCSCRAKNRTAAVSALGLSVTNIHFLRRPLQQESVAVSCWFTPN